MTEAPAIAELQRQIQDARASHATLTICGSGSKEFVSRVEGARLETRGLRGISLFEPEDLVIGALAGTPLAEIEATLERAGLMLAFEPPHFGPDGTVGGMVASGWSGPRRAYGAAVRDHVLGVRCLTGRGDVDVFGGRVLKNVAGFDVSRLMVGSWGSLGVLLEVVLRAVPRPAAEETVVLASSSRSQPDEQALLARLPGVSATAWYQESLYVRLSGARSLVAESARRLGGKILEREEGHALWVSLRDHTHPFFGGGAPLWRISVAATESRLPHHRHELWEWGGALRWVRTEDPPDRVWSQVAAVGGHATAFRGHARTVAPFQPLSPALLALHGRIKSAFDPDGLFASPLFSHS